MKTIAEIALETVRNSNNGHLFNYPPNMLKLDRDKYHAKVQRQNPWKHCIGLRWIGRDTLKEPGDDWGWPDEKEA